VVSLTVSRSKVVKTYRRSPLGVNLNCLTDAGRSARAPRSLTDALRDLGVRALRYPGPIAENFLWSVPPFDKPRPSLARHGKGEITPQLRRFVGEDGRTLRPGVMGFDAFLSECVKLGAEPFVAVPCCSACLPPEPDGFVPERSDLLKSAAQWVRYASAKNPVVRYWEIGSESYRLHSRCGASAEEYARDIALFSAMMRVQDPLIRILACGPTSAWPAEPPLSERDRIANTPVSWWDTVLAQSGRSVDAFAFHEYPAGVCHDYESYAQGRCDLMKSAGGIRSILERHGKPARPAFMTGSNTESLDAPPSLGSALILFELMGQIMLGGPVEAVILLNTRSLDEEGELQSSYLDTLDGENRLLPAGEILRAWNENLLNSMLKTQSESPVQCYATALERQELRVLMVNRSTRAQDVSLTIEGGLTRRYSRLFRAFTGSGPDDRSPEWQTLERASFTGGAAQLRLPPVSLSIMML